MSQETDEEIKRQKKKMKYLETQEQFEVLIGRQDTYDPLPRTTVIWFSAEWCGPCKKIAHIVEAFFASSPDNVICADIDVDESIDLYSYLKQRRMVNGIPVMLMYKKGNVSFAPDDSVTGSDPGQLDAFFKRCGLHLLALQRAQALTQKLVK
jgi:thiol-disulfide isomerase/thioredoxin